ncbi:hypothetical protein GGS26DRAFT_102538 [Hypomontagnella submonticulosa]|nr:hypothetical protein GGS26DRAFT_102538 [Hypomontagnella submonticulosa]
MRYITLILAISVAVSASPIPVPDPEPAADVLSDTIIDSVGSILGTDRWQDDVSRAKCYHNSGDDIATCINRCVTQCLMSSSGCNSCIRGCSPQHFCNKHHHQHHQNDEVKSSRHGAIVNPDDVGI